MTNHLETEGTDYKYEVLVTTSHGEIISHTEATTWDVDEAGRLFLYNETATRLNVVATYNEGMWRVVTRVTEEVYEKIMAPAKEDENNTTSTTAFWLAKRDANRRKLQGH